MLNHFKRNSLVWLTIIILFHLACNILWVRLDNTPPAWDEANNTKVSFEFLYFFQNVLSGHGNVSEFLQPFSDYYGPLVRFLTAMFLLLSPSIELAQFVGTVFFLGAIVMVYLLGREMFMNEWVGLFASFTFSFFPIVYDQARWLLLDIPLIFFVLLSMYFLIKSNLFANTRHTLFAFVSLSLVGLTKLQGLIYLLFPLLFLLAFAIKRREVRSFYHLFLGGALFLFLLGLWVVPTLHNFATYFFIASTAEPFVDPTNILVLTTWTHYFKLFLNHGVGFFTLTFFFVFLVFFLKSESPYKFFTLFYIFFYYVLFTLFPNKDMRFLFPILPFIALVFANGFLQFHSQKQILGTLFLYAFMLSQVTFYLSLSFGFPFRKGLYRQFLHVPVINEAVYVNLSEYPVRKFDSRQWPTGKIALDIASLDGRPKRVLGIVDNARVNNNTLGLFLTAKRITNTHFESPFDINEFQKQGELEEYVQRFDYALVAKEDINPFYILRKKALDQLREYFTHRSLPPLLQYMLPTGETIFVYPIIPVFSESAT